MDNIIFISWDTCTYFTFTHLTIVLFIWTNNLPKFFLHIFELPLELLIVPVFIARPYHTQPLLHDSHSSIQPFVHIGYFYSAFGYLCCLCHEVMPLFQEGVACGGAGARRHAARAGVAGCVMIQVKIWVTRRSPALCAWRHDDGAWYIYCRGQKVL